MTYHKEQAMSTHVTPTYLTDVVTVRVGSTYHDLMDWLSDPDSLDELTTWLSDHDQAPNKEEGEEVTVWDWIDAASDDATSIIRAVTGDGEADVYDVGVGEAIMSDLAADARGQAIADLAEAVQQIEAGIDPLPDTDEPMTDDPFPGDWSGLVAWDMGADFDGLGCRWVVEPDDVPPAARDAWQEAGYAGNGDYGTVGDVSLADLTLTTEQRQAVDQWLARKFVARS